MDCNEFPKHIINVYLLTEGNVISASGTDVVFNIPANIDAPTVTVATSSTKNPDVLLAKAPGSVGTPLLMNPEDATVKSSSSVKVGGTLSKVTLEYTVFYPLEDPDDYHTQLNLLRQRHYSLLIEFMGQVYALVRCEASGEGWHFTSSEGTGKLTNTITISNVNALQKVRTL